MLYIHVLSKSVADALAYFGDPATEETEKFIRYTLIGCLTVLISEVCLNGRQAGSRTDNPIHLPMTVDYR